MSNPSLKSSIADNRTAFADYQELSGGLTFRDRLQQSIEAKGLKAVELSRLSGVPPKRISEYLKGPKVATAEYLFPLANALSVSAEWLVLGKESRPAHALVDASDADWESVPFFDLKELTDTGKGAPESWTPFRKDWLNRTLGTSVELYLVRLVSDYRSRTGDRDLAEGDLVFCREITPIELADGHVCIFRRDQGLKVARYSLRPRERVDEDVITSDEIAEDKFVPVARILGKFAQRL